MSERFHEKFPRGSLGHKHTELCEFECTLRLDIERFITSELTSLLQDIVGKKQTLDFKQFGGIYEAVSLEDIQKIGEEWGIDIKP